VVTISPAQVSLHPGTSARVTVDFTGVALGPGAHEGVIVISPSSSGTGIRLPYWYGVPADVPQHITVLASVPSETAGSVVPSAVLFRVTDAAGITSTLNPLATTLSGGGSVLGLFSLDADFPGVYGLTVQLGPLPGTNQFQVQAGGQVQVISILGR
jgi:hypothetical protein